MNVEQINEVGHWYCKCVTPARAVTIRHISGDCRPPLLGIRHIFTCRNTPSSCIVSMRSPSIQSWRSAAKRHKKSYHLDAIMVRIKGPPSRRHPRNPSQVIMRMWIESNVDDPIKYLWNIGLIMVFQNPDAHLGWPISKSKSAGFFALHIVTATCKTLGIKSSGVF